MSAQKTVDDNEAKRKIAAALDMVRRGFKVFPLRDYGDFKERKRPLHKGWQADATTDAAIITRIWTDKPGAGIGASTDGFVVLDLDPKGDDIHETGKRIVAKFGPLPETLVCETGSGGEHIVMKQPEGTEARSVKNAVGLMWGVDNRSDGGYIVAPGSHLDPGMKPYRIKFDHPIAIAPTSIVAALRRNAMKTVAGTDMEHLDSALAVRTAAYVADGLPECSEGGRNNAAHEYAHVMRECGLSANAAFEALHEHWNLRAVSPPLDVMELRNAINSAFAKVVNTTPTGFRLDAVEAVVAMGRECQMAGPPPEKQESEFIDASELGELDFATVKPRPWIVSDVCAVGYVTAVVGHAGVSKSTWLIHLAVAIAANRPNMILLPDGKPPKVLKQGMVFIYNGEDDRDEMTRRLHATLIANGIKLDEVRSRIRFASGAEDGAEPLIIASTKGDTAEVNEKAIQKLIRTAKHHEASVIIVDPLQELHNVLENSNEQMRMVGSALRRVAKATGAAVVMAGHARKPDTLDDRRALAEAGNVNILRGASSMSGVIRLAWTVTNMVNEVAAVPVEERGRYVRLTMAKNNFGRPDSSPVWYKRVGVTMGPLGEEFDVGALVPWTFSRLEEQRAPVWCALERIMLEFPDMFPRGAAYAPAKVLHMGNDADKELIATRNGLINAEMERWLRDGPVKQGVTYNLLAKRAKFGNGWKYTVEMIDRDPGEEVDFLG